MADASPSVRKNTKINFAAEHGFLDRMARYLISGGGPGRKGSSSGHILRAECSMESHASPALQSQTHRRNAEEKDQVSARYSNIRAAGLFASHPFAKNAKGWGTLILDVI